MSEENFYLTQRELFDELIKCRIKGEISDTLGSMFVLLSAKYSNHRNFVRYYHLKKDLVAAGCEACCRAFSKFRPYKDKSITWDEETHIVFDHNIHNNSFAYFTTAIHNNFLSVVKSEYNQSNIMNEMRLDNGLDASFGYEDMVAEKEAREKAERLSEEESEVKTMKSLTFDDQSVWYGFSEDDSLVDEEEDDDSKIDWGSVAR